jgi:UDPglucose 6-dehydrogenase
VCALIKTSQLNGYQPRLLEAVELVNDDQKLVLVKKVVKRFGEDLSGKIFAVWGLAFKPGTDDMRDAPAITVIKELVKRGAKIRAYDPKAVEQAQTCYLKDVENIQYFDSKYDVLNDADALVLITEWKEFRSPDFDEMKMRLSKPIIFDGRNQYDYERIIDLGYEYYQVGKKA